MNKLIPLILVAGGIATLGLSINDWLKLGVEVALGLLAVIMGSLTTQQHS